MDSELPKNNVLVAIGSAIVVSVVSAWTMTNRVEQNLTETIKHEVRLIHERINTLDGRVWTMPDAPRMPGEKP